MFVMPLKRMRLRKKDLESSYGASFGHVRKWNVALHKYTRFHQGWDLEAPKGTECYAIAGGVITHVGHHPQWGRNIVLEFSKAGLSNVSAPDPLWAFYAHLSFCLVFEGALVSAGDLIALSGYSGNASASAPHLHFEIRNVPDSSPGLGTTGRLDPGSILGYNYLSCG